ncbi:MAG: toll/interleukin-1 receptor domain-containing protein [Bacteroidota bacterium]
MFISHSGEDKEALALPLHQALVSRGIHSFFDEQSMDDEVQIPDRIVQAMDNAQMGVFILSPDFIAKKWPTYELACFLLRHEKAKVSKAVPPALLPVFCCGLTPVACQGDYKQLKANYAKHFSSHGFSDRMDRGETSYGQVAELLHEICDHKGLEGADLTVEGLVQTIADAVSEQHIVSLAFGASDWKKYFGVDVGAVPPLPGNIDEILNSASPFRLEDEKSRQRVGANHLLTLIPATVDGVPFTLDKLGELILRYFPENNRKDLGSKSHGFRYYSTYLTTKNRSSPLSSTSYWLLLPKTILPDSRSKDWSSQKALASAYIGSGYGIPRALEVATSVLSHYAKHKERLYADASSSTGNWTYTRCADLDEYGYPLVVGGFAAAGLAVDYGGFDYYDKGVAVCRKF